MKRTTRTDISPATPGFFVVELTSDSTEIARTPVVAWRIDGDGATPICLQPLGRDGYGFSVLCPDGTVIAGDGTIFFTLELWRSAAIHDRECREASEEIEAPAAPHCH